MTPFPSYPDDHLSQLDPSALIELLVGDEDRTPRNVIDAAARRGDTMVAALENHLAGPWQDPEEDGEWWLRLHAVMILGLIAHERAGLLLVDFMRRMTIADDDNLQDWLAGDWPAFFANKPASVVRSLRDLCVDRALDWYIRANALDPVVAAAERQGPETLDEALAWVAQMAADEQEDWEVRLWCGNVLIDFPRDQYRPLLDDLAKRQHGWGINFSGEDISRAYAARSDQPDWRKRGDPWAFYRPESIARRQERWAKEDAAEEDDDNFAEDAADALELPYVRETPKVGRNDPCLCGSGKKYKRCCLPTMQA